MHKYLTQIKVKLHKIKAKIKNAGSSLPIFILILLTFSAILTISIAQSRRESTISQAATTCPKGVGTYMQKVGCEQICGAGKCKDCMLSSTTKWYCDAPLAEKGYNLPTCSGKSFNLQSACIAELGSCTKCSFDGTAIRWHQGTDNSTITSGCTEMNCQQLALPGTKLDRIIYADKTTLRKYYPNTRVNCSGASMSQDRLVSYCTESSGCTEMNCQQLALPGTKLDKIIYADKTTLRKYYPNTTVNCSGASMNNKSLEEFCTDLTPTKISTTGPINTPASIITPTTNTPAPKPAATSKPTATNSIPNIQCSIGEWVDNNGVSHSEQKVPCTFSTCGVDGCADNLVKVTAGGNACCFQSAINECVSSSSCNSAKFIYPQTVYQPILIGWQTANTGEQIDCNNNFCIEL